MCRSWIVRCWVLRQTTKIYEEREKLSSHIHIFSFPHFYIHHIAREWCCMASIVVRCYKNTQQRKGERNVIKHNVMREMWWSKINILLFASTLRLFLLFSIHEDNIRDRAGNATMERGKNHRDLWYRAVKLFKLDHFSMNFCIVNLAKNSSQLHSW
jgi:hypothetical protein